MKIPKLFCVALAFGLVAETLPAAAQPHAPPPLARWHFVGGNFIADTDQAAKFQEVLRLPESEALFQDLLQRLSRDAGGYLKARGARGGAGVLRLLLDDLMREESFGEWRTMPDGSAQFLLAIRLPRERAAEWENALKELSREITGTTPRRIRVRWSRGWEAGPFDSPHLFRFVRARDWVVIGCGRGPLTAHSDLVRTIREKRRPVPVADDYWLEAEADGPALQSRLRRVWPFIPARTLLRVAGGEEYLRTSIRATYPEPVEWQPDGWQLPTDVIREPLVSFSAARNIAPFLKDGERLARISLNPAAGQFFTWAQAHVPFQTFMAMPVEDAGAALEKLAGRLPDSLNERLEQRRLGKLRWAEERGELIWEGLPIIVPFIRAVKDDTGQYLLGGFFPAAAGKQPPPPELIDQVAGRENLVFYHWEITEARLMQWRMLSQLLPLFPTSLPGRDPQAPPITPDLPGQRWLTAVAPLLGNTATEVTFSAPNELNLVRRSHAGFTGFELVAIINFLRDPQLDRVQRPSSRQPVPTGEEKAKK